MDRAYSILHVKSIEDDKRIIRGTATTPRPDRVGDIVEPLGIQFKNPMPLLLYHQTDKPVGLVKFEKPSKEGVTFEAHLPFIEEAGVLKDRVDEAWQSIKAGLVAAVSIGFKALEKGVERMKDGGLRFLASEVLELSLVTIPSNRDATIAVIKSIDTEQRAASGHDEEAPGATGKPTTPAPKERKKMSGMTLAEQRSAFENTRAAKAARMTELMTKAGDGGVTLDDAESDEYDGLETEVNKIDDHLVRLGTLEKANKAAAKPVEKVETIEKASEARGGGVISVRPNVPPGTAFIRKFLAIYNGKQHGIHPADYFKGVPEWQNTPEVEIVLRAPVAAGTTTNSTWAAPLVVAENMASEFAALLRPLTIIGRIPGLTRVPFNIKIPRETTGASVGWVGEGAVKPVSAMAFDQITLLFNKVAGIVPITEELLRFSSPAAEGLIRDSLTKGIAQFVDRDFLDPTKSAVTGVSPASITNGVTPITASGSNADALRADLGNLLAVYTAANANLAGLVLVMTSTQAMRIALMRNTLGQREFEGLGRDGGSLETIPVVVSENIVATGGSPTDGYLIVAINAPEILLADDGGVDIDVSREASLQMNTAPDSPETASTILVSLWQRNMVGIKAERFITWTKRRSDAVQFIQNAKYA